MKHLAQIDWVLSYLGLYMWCNACKQLRTKSFEHALQYLEILDFVG